MNGQSENNDLKKKFEEFTYPVDEANWDAISSRIFSDKGSGFLASKFAAFTSQPSPDVWRNVEASLQPGKKKRPVAFWWYGAAAGLLLFIFLGYETYRSGNLTTPIAQEKSISKSETTAEESLESTGNNSNSVVVDTIREEYTPTSTEGTALKENSNHPTKSQNQKNASVETEALAGGQRKAGNEANSGTDNPTSFQFSKSAENSVENIDQFAGGSKGRVNPGVKIALRNPFFQPYPFIAELAGEMREIPVAAASAKEENKSTDFYNGLETQSSSDISLWAGSQIAIANPGPENSANSSAFAGIGTGAPLSSSLSSNTTYAAPVYYGINGEIGIWKRISAGIGLGYLQMQSTATYYLSNGRHVVEETRSYLSIPLYLKVNFVQKPKFAAYTSLGHAFDIMVGQNLKSETPQSSQVSGINTAEFGNTGNQANVYTSIGMSYNFTKNLGVFGEGSVLHYYHTKDVNFYSQQKFWPGLKFGLLYSFD